MRSFTAATLLLVALVLGHADARAQAIALVGAWDATAMEIGGKKKPVPPSMSMTVAFDAANTMTLTMRSSGRETRTAGTYVVQGATIHVTMDGKTDRLRYEIAGNALTLSKIGTTEVLYLVRAPARP